jgi:hypothetical protein
MTTGFFPVKLAVIAAFRVVLKLPFDTVSWKYVQYLRFELLIFNLHDMDCFAANCAMFAPLDLKRRDRLVCDIRPFQSSADFGFALDVKFGFERRTLGEVDLNFLG